MSQSVRLPNELKEALYSLLKQAQLKYDSHEFVADRTVSFAYKIEEEISLVEL